MRVAISLHRRNTSAQRAKKRGTTIAFCCTVFFVLLLAVKILPAQEPSRFGTLRQQQRVHGGLGLTAIDGKPYYLFYLRPELTFGKIGVGLDLNLRFREDGNLRQEDWDEGYDYLRVVRYLRYGTKHDPFYARAGSLDYARLGYGSIVSFYRNSPSYDLRRVGAEMDGDFGLFGCESVLSDIGATPLFGIRLFGRPLYNSPLSEIPVLGGMEVGGTYASDLRTDSRLTLVGADIGFPLLRSDILGATLYTDIVKIIDYGSGAAVGTDVRFMGLGLVTLDARYERRFQGDRYLHSYFDALYERDRIRSFSTPGGSVVVLRKRDLLEQARKSEGYYGELWINVIGTFHVIGAYHSPVGVRNAGTIHLELETGNALPGIFLAAGYDKSNVGSLFKLDQHALLRAEVGYVPYPFVFVSCLYEWSFTEERGEDGTVRGYRTHRRVEPRVGILLQF